MTEDTLFRIYSMTKPITSVAMMMLVEEARCCADRSGARYIPSWEHMRVYRYGAIPTFQTEPPRRPMTIRDLMTHMSGLTYGFMAPRCGRCCVPAHRRRAAASRAKIGRRRSRRWPTSWRALPLLFSPGTRWNYSVSTDMLGYLVEVISGKRFDVFLRERIFEPLGMRHTDFSVPDGRGDRFAANYRREAERRRWRLRTIRRTART